MIKLLVLVAVMTTAVYAAPGLIYPPEPILVKPIALPEPKIIAVPVITKKIVPVVTKKIVPVITHKVVPVVSYSKQISFDDHHPHL